MDLDLNSSINLDSSMLYGIDVKAQCNKLTDLAQNVSEEIETLSKDKTECTFETQISLLFSDCAKNENFIYQMIELYHSKPTDIDLWRDLIYAHFIYNSQFNEFKKKVKL